MKKLFKKSLVIFLSSVVLLTALPLPVSAATISEVDQPVGVSSGNTGNCQWLLESFYEDYQTKYILTISGNGNMGYFGNGYAPWGNDVTEVTIHEGVTNISSYAFSNCYNLETISIPSSVTNIGDGAFAGCSNLRKVDFNHSNPSFDDSIFNSCNKYSLRIYGDSNSNIENYANNNGFKFIGTQGVVGGCTWLREDTKLTISGTGSIPDYQQWNYNAPWGDEITQIIIEDGVTGIGNNTFYGCTLVKGVFLPSSIEEIGTHAFSNPQSMFLYGDEESYSESYAISNGIHFVGTTGIVGECSWTRTNAILTISGIGEMDDFALEYNLYQDKEYITLPWGNAINQVIFEEGITRIGNCCFYESKDLTDISIPSSVTTIGERAFQGCTSLMSIDIPYGVTNIEARAFEGCSLLKNVNISQSVKTIGAGAFKQVTAQQPPHHPKRKPSAKRRGLDYT